MTKKLPKTLVKDGSECLLCGDTECNLMGRNNRYTCEPCATTAFMMFQRCNQLETLSDEVSIKRMAEQNGEYKDAEGQCACPACCFNLMLEIDPVMNDLKHGGGTGPFARVNKGTVH